MLKFFNISNIEEIAIVEQKAIKSLVKNKYATNAWNFGYSPKYTVSSSVKIENEVANLQLKVVDGMIVKINKNLVDFLVKGNGVKQLKDKF